MQHIDNANPSDVPPAQLNRAGRIKRRVPAHGAGEAADSNSSGGIVFFSRLFLRAVARFCAVLKSARPFANWRGETWRQNNQTTLANIYENAKGKTRGLSAVAEVGNGGAFQINKREWGKAFRQIAR